MINFKIEIPFTEDGHIMSINKEQLLQALTAGNIDGEVLWLFEELHKYLISKDNEIVKIKLKSIYSGVNF